MRSGWEQGGAGGHVHQRFPRRGSPWNNCSDVCQGGLATQKLAASRSTGGRRRIQLAAAGRHNVKHGIRQNRKKTWRSPTKFVALGAHRSSIARRLFAARVAAGTL